MNVYPDAAGVAHAAAAAFVASAQEFIARAGAFHAALSGGSTPRALFRVLAGDEFRAALDWAGVHLYWGDERCVPPGHPDSNYGMAQHELIAHIGIPPGNIHRMEAELPDADRAAREYEETLRRNLPLDAQGFPRFDLIFLGMGPDGHTASLFPGADTLLESSRWVSAPYVAKFQARRMTLTMPVLNAAHRVIFLVSGAEKAETLRAVIEGTARPEFPAQLVKVPNGERLFLVDECAAARLGR